MALGDELTDLPGSSDSLVADKVNYSINYHEIFNLGFTNLFTLASIAYKEFSDPNDELTPEDSITFSLNQSKGLGMAAGLACSFTLAVIWYITLYGRDRGKTKDQQTDIYASYKKTLEPWYRLWKEYYYLGISIGNSLVELDAVIPGFALIPPWIKLPIKAVVSSTVGLLLGVLGLVYGLAIKPALHKLSSSIFGIDSAIAKFFADVTIKDIIAKPNDYVARVGKDGGVRYKKFGNQIGMVVGAAIGAFLPIPGGMALGMALGGVIGWALFAVFVPVINKLFVKHEDAHDFHIVDLSDLTKLDLKKHNKCYLYDETLHLLFYVRNEKLEKAPIDDQAKFDEVLKKFIGQEPAKNLTKKLTLPEIEELIEKNGGHVPNRLYRTQFMRSGFSLGFCLGGVAAFLAATFLFPGIGYVVPLCIAIFAVVGAVAFAIAGPHLIRAVNPLDFCYSSPDFGARAGVSWGQSVGLMIGGIFEWCGLKQFKDLIAGACGFVGGLAGGGYDIKKGIDNRNLTQKKFKDNKPMIPWSQCSSIFVALGAIAVSIPLSIVGFAAGGPIGAAIFGGAGFAICMGAGGAISGLIGVLAGDKIYSGFAGMSTKIAHRVFREEFELDLLKPGHKHIKGKFYVKEEKDELQYAFLTREGKLIEGKFTKTELEDIIKPSKLEETNPYSLENLEALFPLILKAAVDKANIINTPIVAKIMKRSSSAPHLLKPSGSPPGSPTRFGLFSSTGVPSPEKRPAISTGTPEPEF